MGIKKFGIRGKLIISFLTVVILSSFAMGIGVYSFVKTNQQYEHIKEQQELINAYDSLSFLIVRSNAAIRGYLLFGEERMANNFQGMMVEYEEILSQVKKAEKEIARVEELDVRKSAWEQKINNDILQALKNGNRQKAMDTASVVLSKDSTNLVLSTREMAAEKQQQIEETMQRVSVEGKQSQSVIIIISVIVSIIGIILGVVLGNKITKPIIQIVSSTEKIAQGNLTAKMNIKSTDEIGRLSKSINKMTDNLKRLVEETADLSEQVSSSSEELSISSSEISVGIEQVSRTTEELSSGANSQAKYAIDSNEYIKNTADEVKQVAKKTKEMAEVSVLANKASEEGIKSVQHSIDDMKKIEEKVVLTAGIVHELGDKSSEIVDILEVITDIASQTNLLALNAAIEAARAGEYGKGFAVVADEVRKLAEQSEQSTKQINTIITSLQEKTEHGEKAMDEVVEQVQMGSKLIGVNGDAFKEINDIIVEITNKISEVASAAKHIDEHIDQAVESVQSISAISQETSANSEELAATMEQQNASIQEVAGMAQHLAKTAELLNKSITRFTY